MPEDIDYSTLSSVSGELLAKLTSYRPASIAQASRIDGMTPACLSLLIAISKQNSKRVATG